MGVYSGLRFFGISLNNLKIVDNNNLNSEIVSKNIYMGIMPIRSFLNQKWMFNITPKNTKIEINKDFFKRGEFDNNEKRLNKNKVKYDLNLNFKKYANFKFADSFKLKIRSYFILFLIILFSLFSNCPLLKKSLFISILVFFGVTLKIHL